MFNSDNPMAMGGSVGDAKWCDKHLCDGWTERTSSVTTFCVMLFTLNFRQL